ncbi:MAG: hypothetical protein A3C93_02285 [Candidatus Lloydbacteria bacterium RIFCSPHIGHO2_02_FULL_54_17]|uniref:HIT domain-containing protein n=1 Tax=Candidatus Lloydbacteria bacterium RIFCSPHIGHO2_02_FULL_54_17 TaxID=1798664 RepID=A0A1G2DFL7_9BACT|nr:MAG: hypothetical protein A2762_04625 [Candidatus Lloydbacteria bacterium RIFCSPHIGHO2_01_FULL_54_11]OGZ11741.1 MAG: hypothetical protein A3C93_02285 [Candidatus Lloydbacteria bacterium RIFCSPHIGHO2_02_FULL_54_17]OGZ14270.1 MAG: hypothetical protein A2948_01620 [Candidatus Lloydbacteria bacterium RIFCSPLOWO2_01_FULL_54_18]OGZ16614.1 MAG: hypothetical protein A3H76_04255 [Candidatus Lloydbacteria bacterium RIFCSPLOWO2_02_FULL_54_12]
MKRVLTETKYRPFILKEYPHWTLLLNERQRYLGRAVAWLARRGKMQKFSGLSQRELLELRRITKEYEAALDAIGWKPDHMNYTMLGNYFHEHEGHGHLHIIPRYRPEHRPVFMGVTFKDDRWGKNCTPETPMAVAPEVITGLVRALKGKLA